MSATTIRRLKTDNSSDSVGRFSSSRAYWNGEKTKESINVRSRVSLDRTSVEIHWSDESKPAGFHAV